MTLKFLDYLICFAYTTLSCAPSKNTFQFIQCRVASTPVNILQLWDIVVPVATVLLQLGPVLQELPAGVPRVEHLALDRI